MESLKESLKDWTDIDFAARAVATALGVLPPLKGSWDNTKGLFWSRHSLNVWAYQILRDLCDAGVLEYREEPDEGFRWVGHFPVDGEEHAFRYPKTFAPIRNAEDLVRALGRIEDLWTPAKGTPEEEEFEVWCALVEHYEDRHCELPLGCPIVLIRYKLKELGLTQKAAAKQLGWPVGRLQRLLNYRQILTLDMLRSLADLLNIPPSSLLGKTRLDRASIEFC